MAVLRLQDSREEDFQQVAGLLAQPPRVVPDAEQVGVGLQDVEVGVHRLFLVGVLVAQSHVVDGCPVAGRRLFITVVYGVVGVLLMTRNSPIASRSARSSPVARAYSLKP